MLRKIRKIGGWWFKLLSLLCLCTNPIVSASTVEVPGPLEISGHAWYRAWLMPHDSFFAAHERDLFGESVVLNIRDLAGAHEVFVNGTKIGEGGAFPPDYRDGRAGNHRHKIPSGALVKGQWNEIAIHGYAPSAPAGFLTEAPFVMNYFWECVLEGPWEFQEGEDATAWLGGAVAERPERATFDAFHESNRVLGEAETLVHGDKLPPLDSLARLHPAEDLQVDLLLHEPLVAQPVYLSFDERGRLWVAQYRQYPYPAGLKMLSRDRYYRSHYDKVPPPPPHHEHGRDVISIHEDTDGDGVFDKHKVFQDGLNLANAALRGRGGVWVMHTPYLLFYPDADFDDVPDGPPMVHLSGFGFEDTHSVANGLVWGMDGWLYGAQGSTTSCRVLRPGIDPPGAEGVYFEGCMVWRYHPERRDFELFAEGGGNNFGLEVDAQGRLFTGHNGGQTRGFHYIQEGLYQMQGVNPGKFGPPRNPFAFGDLPMMQNEQPIQRFTHFAALAEGTAMPERYRGAFFALDPIHSFIIASRREKVGATFRTSDLTKVLTSDDESFRPVYIVNAPDGSFFIADFYEHYIAHGQHYQSQIDPTTGRIYRLRGEAQSLENDLDLSGKSTSELIELLGHANKWHRHTAVRLLGERRDPRARPALRNLILGDQGLAALNAWWAYYQAFGLEEETVRAGLRHNYPPVRYWAIRLACDRGLVSPDLFADIEEAAGRETDAEVRSQMAASARRLPTGQALALVRRLLAHAEDVNDLYLPLLCWWVLEANAEEARDEVTALFQEASFWHEPMVREHVLPRMMRLLCVKGRRQDYLDAAELLRLAPESQDAARLMTGFEKAFEGRSMSGLPGTLLAALNEHGKASLIVRLRLGDEPALEQAVALLNDEKADGRARLEVARALGELPLEPAVQPLLAVALQGGSEDLRRASMAALMSYADPSIGQTVVENFARLPSGVRNAGLELLLSRTSWTRSLRDAIDHGRWETAWLSEEARRRLLRHADQEIRRWAKSVLDKPADVSDGQALHKIDAVREVLAQGTGNPYQGEAIFLERCAGCHKLFFKGGDIGPDLTAYQRDDLGTMLNSIVHPNAEIREGYQYISVVMKDARQLGGFLTDEDEQVLTLRVLSGEDLRLRRSEIASIEPMGRSLMPEALLDGLNDQGLRDLFAYLRISQPITP